MTLTTGSTKIDTGIVLCNLNIYEKPVIINYLVISSWIFSIKENVKSLYKRGAWLFLIYANSSNNFNINPNAEILKDLLGSLHDLLNVFKVESSKENPSSIMFVLL